MDQAHSVFIGSRLKAAREAAGMTQRQAGDALGTDDSNISAYENARTPIGLGKIYDFAVLYGVALGYFFPRHPLSSSPTNDDLLRDAVIQKVEGLDPIYLSLLDEVVAAFENHDVNKGVGFFRSLLADIDTKE